MKVIESESENQKYVESTKTYRWTTRFHFEKNRAKIPLVMGVPRVVGMNKVAEEGLNLDLGWLVGYGPVQTERASLL